MTKTDMIKSIAILVVICVVISGALAVVNSFTAPIIEDARIARETASRQELLSDAADFEELPLEGLPSSITGAHKGVAADGSVVGYVFTAGNKGFDGTIVVMTAIGTDGSIVKVATMDVTSETKTLGGMTANPEYTDQYTGKDAALEGVSAISGATITSKAYEACVNDSFAAFNAVKEG